MASHEAIPTIKDVAQRAGVSITTVSRVLNGRPSIVPIRESTRERITQAADELRYQPNAFARGLRTRRTQLLGLMAVDFSDPFFTRILREVDRVAQQRGYDVILIVDHRTSTSQDRSSWAARLRSSLVDGILILGSPRTGREFLPQDAWDHHLVTAVAQSTELPILSVDVDTYRGATDALAHLHGLNHRYIGLAINLDNRGMKGRLEAYQHFVESRGLPQLPGYVQTDTHDCEGGERAAGRLLDLPEPPTAIFCATDAMALGAMQAAWKRGWRVPDDISVVGFDDIEIARYLIPPLTTVAQPKCEMGQRATETLIDFIEGKISVVSEPSLVLGCELVVRLSCAPPRSLHR